MIRLLQGIAIGIGIAAVVPAAAAEVAIRCQPIVKEALPPCDNGLGLYFKHGYVPNRCKIS